MNNKLLSIIFQVRRAAKESEAVSAAVQEMPRRVAAAFDAVDALNPYGCNQYGEGWAHPHNGNSTSYQNTKPFGKDSDKRRKVLTHEENGVKTDIATDKAKPGKDAYNGNNAPYADNYKKAAIVDRDAAANQTKALINAVYSGKAQGLRSRSNADWDQSIKTEVIQEYNKTIEELAKKYPGLKIVGVGSIVERKDSIGASCMWNKGTDCHVAIKLNSDHKNGGVHGFKNWKLYAKEEEAATGYKRHNVGATENGISVKDVVTHEYGHALHATAISKDRTVKRKCEAVYRKAKKNGDIKSISKYAATNTSEFVAESFAMRERGEKVPDYINEMLDKIAGFAK